MKTTASLIKSCSMVFWVSILVLGCSVQKPQFTRMGVSEPELFEDRAPEPQLRLSAYPRMGMAPARVTLHAVLEGASLQDRRLGCLTEEWDFGDGSVSAQTLNCDPSTQSNLNTEFLVEHVYASSGVYNVQFKLGDRVVASNRIAIQVLQR